MQPTAAHPVGVHARLDARLSRWWWLLKGLLAIPHFLVLAVLWPAFAVVTLVAFFAILVHGRYPRRLFDLNLGVLRWSWRVAYYTCSVLGTDRYPPFTLADVPDYPARLHIDYPQQLSRGLVLVKWWLLALPHYLVLSVFLSGGYVIIGNVGELVLVYFSLGSFALLGLLVAFAAVVLLCRGRYPDGIYDFLLGINRWILRVVAYVALMTDAYPPFRLDQGGSDPAGPTPPAHEPAGRQAGSAGVTLRT